MGSISDEKELEDEFYTDSNKDTKRVSSNVKLQVIYQELLNFLNEPRVMKFIIQIFIILTGFIMFRILAQRDFPLKATIISMGAWFVLLLLLPTPKSAASGIDPFNDDI